MLDLTSLRNNQKVLEREYWANRLQGVEVIHPLKDHYFAADDVAGSYTIAFTPALYRAFTAIAPNSKAGHLLLLTTLGVLIQKYSSGAAACIFTPVYKDLQRLPEENSVVPVLIPAVAGASFKDIVGRVKDAFMQDLQHSNYPLHHILSLEEQALEQLPVVGCLVDDVQDATAFNALLVDMLFTFSLRDEPALTLKYNPEKFGKNYIESLADAYFVVLQQLVSNPVAAIDRIDLFADSKERLLFQQFNNTDFPYPADQTTITLFEQQAALTPGNIALVCGAEKITYAELDRQSNQFARYLAAEGVTAGQLVPVFMDRGIYLVVAIIAILKLRAAYVPVDTNLPPERIAYILLDTGARVVITESWFSPSLAGVSSIKFIYTSEQVEQWEKYPSEPIGITGVPDDLAYMIYTSGSTGFPKGVLIEHGGMLNHLYAKINDLHINESTAVAQTASYTFDISVWQLFSALLVGGKTIIYTDDLILSPVNLLRAMERDGVTIWECVPSYLTSVLSTGIKLPALHALATILVTGEAVSKSLLEKWFRVYPGKCVVNAYGPTEASDDICHYIMEEAPVYHSVPIGKPVQNTRIYVVDDAGHLCPVGVKGELCVSGIGVGRGYWKDPVKTEKSFVANPFEPEYGFRMYKTGDYARWMPDGNIEYLGRIDEQVKIRGYRIELQEIESLLLQQPGVKQGVVIAKEDEKGSKRLIGYLVLETGTDKTRLDRALSRALPEYMIPGQWVELDVLPLTANGKVDKKALPDISIREEVEYTPPSGETEEKLVGIWSEVLGIESRLIGVNRNFFELGGNSLKILELITILNEELGYHVVITDVFSYPTIASLLGFLLNNENTAGKYKEEAAEELSGMQDLFNQLD